PSRRTSGRNPNARPAGRRGKARRNPGPEIPLARPPSCVYYWEATLLQYSAGPTCGGEVTMTRRFWIGSLLVIACLVGFSAAQTSTEPAAAAPARVQPPSATATAHELEKSADELRQEKLYLDAIDYYREALKRSPANLAVLHNKIGITQLQMGRYPEAKK